MKIYLGHSKQLNFIEELYKPIKESRSVSSHEIIFPHESGHETFLNSLEVIPDCDLMIAEVSFPSTGLGIELGFAHSMSVPIVCLYRQGAKVPDSLKTVCGEYIEYMNSEDLIDKLVQKIIT